jgi:hypothetical protein
MLALTLSCSHSGEGQELRASREKLGNAETPRPRQTHTRAEVSRNAGTCRATQTLSQEPNPGPGDLETCPQPNMSRWNRGHTGSGSADTETRSTPRSPPTHPLPTLSPAGRPPPPFPTPGQALHGPFLAGPRPSWTGQPSLARQGGQRSPAQTRSGGAAPVNPWRPASWGRRKGQEADVPLVASGAAGNPSLLQIRGARSWGGGVHELVLTPRVPPLQLLCLGPPATIPFPWQAPTSCSRAQGASVGAPHGAASPRAPPRQAGSERAARAPPAQPRAQGRRSGQAARPGPHRRPRQAHGPRSPGAALAPVSLSFCFHRKGRSKKKGKR